MALWLYGRWVHFMKWICTLPDAGNPIRYFFILVIAWLPFWNYFLIWNRVLSSNNFLGSLFESKIWIKILTIIFGYFCRWTNMYFLSPLHLWSICLLIWVSIWKYLLFVLESIRISVIIVGLILVVLNNLISISATFVVWFNIINVYINILITPGNLLKLMPHILIDLLIST